jgi:hypothetical protein
MSDIASLPWPKLAKLVNKIIAARGMTMRAFAEEIDEREDTASRWIRANPPQEPRRITSLKIVAWATKHNIAMKLK